jgi:hypothetical protein
MNEALTNPLQIKVKKKKQIPNAHLSTKPMPQLSSLNQSLSSQQNHSSPASKVYKNVENAKMSSIKK